MQHPSGSGKSTMTDLIADAAKQYQGSVQPMELQPIGSIQAGE